MTAYGMTETSGLATLCRPDDDPKTIATTSGKAIPDVELRVVDDDGNDVPDGTAGELLIRGFVIMKGYLDDPEQTAAAIDEGGWLHTGDVVVRTRGATSTSPTARRTCSSSAGSTPTPPRSSG